MFIPFGKNKIIYLFISIIVLINLQINFLAAAPLGPNVDIDKQQQAFVNKSGFDTADSSSLGYIVADLIKAFLGLLGMIFIILIIIAGFGWMTAGGDEEKVRKAKGTMQRAIIGLIIVAAAFSITYFVFKALPGAKSFPP